MAKDPAGKDRTRISVDDLMQKIREEAEKRKKNPDSGTEVGFGDHSLAGSGPHSAERRSLRKALERSFWEYGLRHAKIIKKIPLLRTVAEGYYWRLANSQISRDMTSAFHASPENDQVSLLNYGRFIQQIRKEGLRGKVKLLIFRFIGFFAWWQEQVNGMLYQEITNMKAEMREKDKLLSALLNQQVETLRREIKDLGTTKADMVALEEARAETILTREALEENTGRLERSIEEVRAETVLTNEALEENTGRLERSIEEIIPELRDIARRTAYHKQRILDQERRVSTIFDEVRKRPAGSARQEFIEAAAKEEGHILDSFYKDFEDHFRGLRSDIKERQKIYLPYIRQAEAGTKERPILDVGCGRGEWLELLKENGYAAKGIDINRSMVDQCVELGLEAAEGDVIEYLRNHMPNSLGAITGFHVVEHLPLKTLVELLDETVRVLCPGGVAIFETPNPQNVVVGSCNFYIDPTHKKPLPSATLKYLAEGRGLCRVEILNLHPFPDYLRLEGSELAERFNQLFYGPQDYSVIGYKA